MPCLECVKLRTLPAQGGSKGNKGHKGQANAMLEPMGIGW